MTRAVGLMLVLAVAAAFVLAAGSIDSELALGRPLTITKAGLAEYAGR